MDSMSLDISVIEIKYRPLVHMSKTQCIGLSAKVGRLVEVTNRLNLREQSPTW